MIDEHAALIEASKLANADSVVLPETTVVSLDDWRARKKNVTPVIRETPIGVAGGIDDLPLPR